MHSSPALGGVMGGVVEALGGVMGGVVAGVMGGVVGGVMGGVVGGVVEVLGGVLNFFAYTGTKKIIKYIKTSIFVVWFRNKNI